VRVIFFYPHQDRYDKRVNAFQKRQAEACAQRAMKYLEDLGCTNVRPFCGPRTITGPGGLTRDLDAGAISDDCAIVVLHRNLMEEGGAFQLTDLVAFIE
jgi:hypothetical protein